MSVPILPVKVEVIVLCTKRPFTILASQALGIIIVVVSFLLTMYFRARFLPSSHVLSRQRHLGSEAAWSWSCDRPKGRELEILLRLHPWLTLDTGNKMF